MRAMLDRWAEFAKRGESFDVAAEMTFLTLSIIVDALFGVNLGSRTRVLCEALNVLLDDLGAMGCTQINTPLTFSASSRNRFQIAIRTLDEIVATIIDERRRVPADRADLMSVLLTARDAQTGKNLTDRQIRDEVVTMMIAGHETTAMVLSWAWTLLATNSVAERNLHDEVSRVLGTRPPTLGDLGNLPYTLMVLQESMRLYPPVWFIARKTTSAGDLGGVDVPKDVIVIVSPYAIHRHPGFWNNPDEFNPTRFATGAQHARHSYIPFCGGRHLCLGMHLALIEGHLLLAGITQRYTVRPTTSGRVHPHPAITLRPRNGLMATIHERGPQGTET
jgi:cytochrome P450